MHTGNFLVGDWISVTFFARLMTGGVRLAL